MKAILYSSNCEILWVNDRNGGVLALQGSIDE
jgi:hypothetical protein